MKTDLKTKAYHDPLFGTCYPNMSVLIFWRPKIPTAFFRFLEHDFEGAGENLANALLSIRSCAFSRRIRDKKFPAPTIFWDRWDQGLSLACNENIRINQLAEDHDL